jgi:hypothetical protein
VGPKMAEAAHSTPQEFWRPPTLHLSEEVAIQDARPAMAEACPSCSTEFLLGSRFCHTCGHRRPEAISSSTGTDSAALAGLWERGVRKLQTAISRFPWIKIKLPSRTSFPSFREIKTRVGLPTLSLIAFLIGLACMAGALLSSFVSTGTTWDDFCALQFYRAEWLLAATASFVAGILLKKPSRD